MRYVAVAALAALAGLTVYWITLTVDRSRVRQDQPIAVPPEASRRAPVGRPRWWRRRSPDSAPAEPPGEAFTYVRGAAPPRIPLQTRLLGLLGLVALVALSALALALGLWQAGHLINEQIAKFLER